MTETLAGKIALVTGCGRLEGIGRGCALAMAEAGADIAVTDIFMGGTRNRSETSEAEAAAGWQGLETLVGEIERMGRKAIALTGDVGSAEQAQAMVDSTVAQLGGVDILVNNAGAPHGADRGPSWEIPISAFDEVMRINTRGVMLMSTAVIRHLLARSASGRIINIASGAGKRGFPERAAYCASKFAIVGLTQVMAQELGARDITVNAVCPGAIATARQASREARREEAKVEFEFIKPAIPRVGAVADIARTVLFIAEPAADYITGQAINVDGGILMS